MASAAEPLRVGADEITIRVPSAELDGDLLAAEVRMGAGGGPPLLHRHPSSEIYHVLHGEFSFYVEGADGTVRRRTGSPGAVVAIPGGREHTIRNESDADAEAFVVYAPGAQMEGFARAAARLAEEGTPSPSAVTTLAQRHGIEMTRPIPARTASGSPDGDVRASAD